MATATNQYIFPKTTPTSLVDIPAPFIPPPKPVTPKSLPGAWGGLASNLVSYWNQWINQLFPEKSASIVINDKLWLTDVIAVQGENNVCVSSGVNCIVKPSQGNLGEDIRVYILREGVVQEESWRRFFPAVCSGQTGAEGCENPLFEEWCCWFTPKRVNDKFGESIPGSHLIVIPGESVSTPGTYQFTGYINYDQKAVKELVYDNNFITFTVEVGDPTIKNLGILPSPTPTLEPSENPFYFDDTLIAVQNGNCIQGCSLTPGWVIAGQPVEVYLRGIYKPYKVSTPDNADPVTSAMAACKGLTGQNGCTDQLPVDKPPYLYPNFFYKNPQYGNNQIGPNNPIIVPSGFTRFTIPGNWIPSTGLYAFTFYVNYNQQAAPETDMSDNTKTIYLNASALQQP